MATINISMVHRNPAIAIPEDVAPTGTTLRDVIADVAVAIGRRNNALCEILAAKRLKGTDVARVKVAVAGQVSEMLVWQ